jgi:aldose 1-epimerase
MNSPLRVAALLGILLVEVAPAGAPAAVPWGQTPSGDPIFIYTLVNQKGMEAKVTNFGAILVSLKTTDRHGALGDVVLGYDTFEQYLNTRRYFGATVGRYANRIAKGLFTLDGQTYTLAHNNGENSMHGGVHGFHKAVWEALAIAGPPQAVEFTYLSADGEEGFPGNLSVTVRYTLTDANELQIDYSATTDRPTVVNLTNHSFFNLAGEGVGDVLHHVVTIAADRFTPVDGSMIPTGELRSVDGTPFDLRHPTEIRTHIDEADEQLRLANKGYDHNYVLNHTPGKLGLAARIAETSSGRVMEVYTTEPGMQFYTGNNLDPADRGKSGHAYPPRSAFCVETGHFPDSPNHPEFPSTVLRPGTQFHSTTVFRFRVDTRKQP